MLIIRNDQLAVFDSVYLEHFQQETVKFLLENHPQYCVELGSREVSDFARRAIDLAQASGLLTKGETFLLIEIMIQVGERFEHSTDQANALEILENPRLPGSVKCEMLISCIHASTQGRIVTPI